MSIIKYEDTAKLIKDKTKANNSSILLFMPDEHDLLSVFINFDRWGFRKYTRRIDTFNYIEKLEPRPNSVDITYVGAYALELLQKYDFQNRLLKEPKRDELSIVREAITLLCKNSNVRMNHLCYYDEAFVITDTGEWSSFEEMVLTSSLGATLVDTKLNKIFPR